MTSVRIQQPMAMSDTADPQVVVQRTFERCRQAFCRYFTVRTGGDAEGVVDDLMQQLWLRARLHAKALRDPDPEAWLWRIAQNLLREHRRQHSRWQAGQKGADPELARVLAQRFDTEELPPDVLARKEVRDQLLLALTELPSDDQELLIGFYFEGRSQAALGQALGVSERAVEGRLYRARLALRAKLAHLEA